jgi:hypothetical protein
MKRKILLVSLVLILIVGGIAGGVLAAQAAPGGGKTLPTQRLLGGGMDGLVGMPTEPNVPPTAPPYYRILLSFNVINPDLTYSKTIEKILITSMADQWVYEVPLSDDMKTLSPKEGVGSDFEQLEIHHSIWTNPYLIEIYWSGQGEPLVGTVSQTSYLVEEVEPGNWTVLDFGPIQTSQSMGLYSP